MKPKIFHVIFNLGRGGAENILVQTISQLSEYENIIITMAPGNDFKSQVNSDKIICLNTSNIWQLPIAVSRFKRIIKYHKPIIVHSQLTIPNILSRFSVPRTIPLFSTIQNNVKYNIEFKKWYIRFLEKMSMKFYSGHLIFVAHTVKKDYSSFLNIVPKHSSVIYNFVDTKKFSRRITSEETHQQLRILSVGSLSFQKNFEFLINAFIKADIPNTELHIYGSGPLKKRLEMIANRSNNKIILEGSAKNIENILKNYDLYISSSLYEGLSLSVLEAMSVGIPLLLSDIPSFREQCGDAAIFYQLNNPNDFIEKLKLALSNPILLRDNVQKCQERVEDLFKFENYIHQLKILYSKSVEHSKTKKKVCPN